jgi:ABC-type branched-subunit amino acid transport system substrate-binding protein
MTKFILVAIALLLLTGCTTGKATAQDSVTFGVVLPLSGPSSFYGEFARPAAELAARDINANGGIDGRPLQLIFEDSAADQKQAVTAATKLITVDGVDALITFSNPPASVIAPIAEREGVPMMYASSANSYAENSTFVFKEYLDARDMCAALIEQAARDGHTRIGLFGMNAEFTTLCRVGAQRINHLDAIEYYTAGDKDLRTQLTKIRSKNVTALIVSTFVNDCPAMFEQMHEMQYSPQLYLSFQSFGCGNGPHSKTYAEQLQNAYGADIAVQEDAQYEQLRERLIALNATAHIKGSALMYDMVVEMAQAHQGCSDANCVVENLNGLKHQGMTGEVRFENHIAGRQVHLNIFRNGTWS